MLINYKDYRPQAEAALLIENANEIIEEYEEDGYTLTLRQLYYQFVARDLIPNNQTYYDKLKNAISRGRMAGLISWAAIEDKHRSVHLTTPTMDDVSHAITQARLFISVNHWDNQDSYVEVWVEKDALGNVIEKACDKYEVPYMACKGYLSTTKAWEAGQRFENAIEEGKKCVIIHLGDHDASGINMTKDNQTRVDLFSRSYDVDVRRIALNMDQVEQYNPPPNYQKQTDPRAAEYIEEYGDVSWELDALNPQIMVDMITEEIEDHIDIDIWRDARDREYKLREQVSEIAKSLGAENE